MLLSRNPMSRIQSNRNKDFQKRKSIYRVVSERVLAHASQKGNCNCAVVFYNREGVGVATGYVGMGEE